MKKTWKKYAAVMLTAALLLSGVSRIFAGEVHMDAAVKGYEAPEIDMAAESGSEMDEAAGAGEEMALIIPDITSDSGDSGTPAVKEPEPSSEEPGSGGSEGAGTETAGESSAETVRAGEGEDGAGTAGAGAGEEGTGTDGTGTGEDGTDTAQTGAAKEGTGTDGTGAGEDGTGTAGAGAGEDGTGTAGAGAGEDGTGTSGTGTGEEGTDQAGAGEDGTGTDQAGAGEKGPETEQNSSSDPDSTNAEPVSPSDTESSDEDAENPSGPESISEDAENPSDPESTGEEPENPSDPESTVEEPETPDLDEMISATVTIIFHDDDNRDDVRPGGVHVTLTGSDGSVQEIELHASAGYSATVQVRKYDESGAIIHYQWSQELLVGYEAPEESSSQTEDSIEAVFVNTHISATCTRIVIIEWDDDNDREKIRPESVEVTLYDEDDRAVGTVTVSESGGWTGEIAGLPLFRDGYRIEYHWVQEDIPGYKLEGIMINGFETTLTNSYLMEEHEEEEKVKKYLLTVRYWVGGAEAFPDFTGIYETGAPYSVTSPVKAGYRADKPVVKGRIRSNTVVNVYYSPGTYNLTVYYRYYDGSAAAAAYHGQYKTDSAYSVESPYIPGYSASRQVVSGTMPGRNVTFVVYYSLNETEREDEGERTASSPPEPEYTVIDEYNTPLGLGAVAVNVGECFE